MLTSHRGIGASHVGHSQRRVLVVTNRVVQRRHDRRRRLHLQRRIPNAHEALPRARLQGPILQNLFPVTDNAVN